jgi:K+-sensing histidine kinase KdpD
VVADKHKGSIEAANHPSGGAMFTLRLPCESAQPD